MDSDVEILSAAIRERWSLPPDPKVQRYIGKFFTCTRMGTKIKGRVEGNHGIYTVTIEIKNHGLFSACSCYIGKEGFCHHCHALAMTFLKDNSAFMVVTPKLLARVNQLADVPEYLTSVTLESLLAQLKEKGIAQKNVAEAIGLSPNHLSSMKSSELRNRLHKELGATKLACLWLLEHFGKTEQ
jgi:uncharacterized Zn finger protein